MVTNIFDFSELTGESGVYAGADLPESYNHQFAELCKRLELPTPDDLHCTVVYSSEDVLQYQPKHESPLVGMVASVQSWIGHNGDTYIVADVHSPGLIVAHMKFARAGAKHAQPAYRPHVTLGRMKTPTPELESDIESLNEHLKLHPFTVVFPAVTVKDIKKD